MTDATARAIEATVLAAITGRTVMAPVGLSELIEALDYFESIVPSRVELDECLAGLVDPGLIGELEGQRFVDRRSAEVGRAHVAVTDAAYEAALAGHQPFGRTGTTTEDRADPEPPSDQQLLVRVPIAGGRMPSPNDWRVAEDLATQMCQDLGQRGRTTRVVTLQTKNPVRSSSGS